MDPTNSPVGACISALYASVINICCKASIYFPICFGFPTAFCTFEVSSKITELMMCIALSLRLYLRGAAMGCCCGVLYLTPLLTGTSQ
eukprot:905049-Ditylum_brightwellii.AAC.1